jgi:hypothetical protein
LPQSFPNPLDGTLSLLSQQRIDSQDVAAEDLGFLDFSEIVSVDIQPIDKHHNEEDKASSREQGESGTVTEGTPGSFEHRGKKSRASHHVRADIDVIP